MLYAKTAWWLPDDAAVARRDAALAAIAAGTVSGEGGSDGAAAGERVRCRVYAAPTAALPARVAEPGEQS